MVGVMRVRDPYRVLGVPTDATAEQIRRAYRRRARELHPDLAPPKERPHRTRRFQELQEAYVLLVDEGPRRAYDARVRRPFRRRPRRVQRDPVEEFFLNLLRSMMRR